MIARFKKFLGRDSSGFHLGLQCEPRISSTNDTGPLKLTTKGRVRVQFYRDPEGIWEFPKIGEP